VLRQGAKWLLLVQHLLLCQQQQLHLRLFQQQRGLWLIAWTSPVIGRKTS
jgi:hypothetical protein